MLLSIAFAQTPQNHNNIGRWNLAYFELTGPVKQLKECFQDHLKPEVWDCNTKTFNTYGISQKEIENRTLIQKGERLVFKVQFDFDIENLEFKDGLLIRTVNLLGDLEEFKYENRKLIKTTATVEGTVANTKTYHYSNGILDHVVDVYFDWRGNFSNQSILYFYANGLLHKNVSEDETLTYTYTYDKQGNWTEKKENGRLITKRTIEYY